MEAGKVSPTVTNRHQPSPTATRSHDCNRDWPSGGLSLENEIRLAKPALLYADSVTLISPVATLLQAAADVGASEDSQWRWRVNSALRSIRAPPKHSRITTNSGGSVARLVKRSAKWRRFAS